MRLFFILLIGGLTSFSALAAGSGTPKVKLSSFYDVAIAEAFLQKQPLDVEKLVASDPFLAQKPDAELKTIVPQLTRQINTRYAAYILGNTPIVARLRLRVHVLQNPPALKLGFDPQHLPYFSYDVMGRTIAVMPKDIGQYNLVPLAGPEEAQRAASIITSYGSQIIIDMIPSYVSEKPVILDKISQYIMIADVSSIRVLNGAGSDTIWSYVNPKYGTTYDNGLKGLYGGSGTRPTGPGFSTP